MLGVPFQFPKLCIPLWADFLRRLTSRVLGLISSHDDVWRKRKTISSCYLSVRRLPQGAPGNLISLACPPITETTSGRVDGVPDRPTRPQSHPGGTAAPEDLTIVPSNPGVQEGCWRLIIKALLLSLCALTHAVRFIDAPFFLSRYCFISINDVMPGV